jgi:hypothetical protein
MMLGLPQPILILTVFCLIGVNCGRDHERKSASDEDMANEVLGSMRIKFHGVASDTKKVLISDFWDAKNRFIVSADSGSPFDKVFGGTSNENIIRYLDKRLSHFLPSNTKLVSKKSSSITPFSESVTVASNLGTAQYITNALEDRSASSITFPDGTKLDINSTRVGLIKLGAYENFGKIKRISTLVHEGRHSDCPYGLDVAELKKYEKGDEEVKTEALSCGMVHTPCPDGHEFEGQYACDRVPWGAYAVGGVYLSAVGVGCTSCTEAERHEALVSAYDAYNRLLFNSGDLLSGDLGNPKMD